MTPPSEIYIPDGMEIRNQVFSGNLIVYAGTGCAVIGCAFINGARLLMRGAGHVADCSFEVIPLGVSLSGTIPFLTPEDTGQHRGLPAFSNHKTKRCRVARIFLPVRYVFG